MKLHLSFVPLILFLLSTCNQSKEAGVIVERLKTDAPVKLLVGATKNDSTKIFLYAPQKLKLTNNYSHKVRLSQVYISLNGANIMAENPLYLMKDSLVWIKGATYQSGEESSYLLYARYKMVVHNAVRDSLRKNGTFTQMKNKRKVYDIGNIKASAPYLNRKVPDSLKGFLHLDFYNFETREGFVENVPIAF